jgi:hypothetical protein
MSESIRATRALAHPVILVSIGLLLVNDHVLKAVAPGWLTGKVSDFAGLAFFPLLVAIVVGPIARRWALPVAVGVTGTWFTLIKTSVVASHATERMVESLTGSPATIVVDPTDLLALPAMATAVWAWNRSVQASPRARVVIVAVAALSVIATSNVEDPSVFRVLVVGDVVVVDSGEYGIEASDDFGDSWRAGSAQEAAALDSSDRLREACSATGELCIRGTDEVVQEKTGDGEWRVGWSFPEERRGFVNRLQVDGRHDFWVSDIAFVESVDGPVAFVAMAEEGLLRRRVDGSWQRDVTGVAPPMYRAGAGIGRETTLGLSVGAMMLVGVAFFLGSRGRSASALERTAVVVGVGASMLAAWIGYVGDIVALLLLPVGAVLVAALSVLTWQAMKSLERMHEAGVALLRPVSMLIVPLVVAAAIFGIAYAWSAGTIERLSSMYLGGLGVTVAGSGVLVGLRRFVEGVAAEQLPSLELDEDGPAGFHTGLGKRLWPAVLLLVVLVLVSPFVVVAGPGRWFIWVVVALRLGTGYLLATWAGADGRVRYGIAGAVLSLLGLFGFALVVAGRLGPDRWSRRLVMLVAAVEVVAWFSGGLLRSSPLLSVGTLLVIGLIEQGARSAAAQPTA